MKVIPQILKEYARRTEYKVLKEWYEVTEREIHELQPGICIVPGIVLSRAGREQVGALASWAREWGNHLILTAPWWKVALAEYLDLPMEIEVDEKKSEYQGINTTHILVTKLPPLWQNKKGDNLAASLHYHSGSGVVTITTLPLLDYKLAAKRSICQSLLAELLSREDNPGSAEAPAEGETLSELTEEHLMVLLLAAGGIDIHDGLAIKVKQYLTVDLTGKEISLQHDLQKAGLLNKAGLVTDEGLGLLVGRGYRPFIRELRKQGDMDAW